MKINGFEVGEYAVKAISGKKNLVFDCKDCIYGASISDDSRCRFHVFHALQELEADLIVFSEVYERVYDEKQVKMLSDIARLVRKFEQEAVWSSENLGLPEFEKNFGERHDALVGIAHDLISYDPIGAYLKGLQELKRIAELAKATSEENQRKDLLFYLKTVNYVKEQFEKTILVDESKKVLLRLKEIPDTREFYRMFFEAQIKPAFIGSRLAFEQKEDFELLDDYAVAKSSVQIFKHPHKPQKLYFVNPPEYSLPPEKYFIWSKAKEIVASYKPGKITISTIAKSRKYFERIYESTIIEIAKQNSIHLTAEEVSELAEIVARYTVGYGILEILLSDRHITDIYLDAPIGSKPIYIVHSDFGQCITNISYSEEEAGALVSKLRAMSGRPFDESHPVLDFDLEELEVRVAVIGPPLSPDGTAFAFRLHKTTPWTLCQFIDNKMITPLGAGLLSFFIDTQATMLVTGSRGSGKTSLMQALMLEIPQNSRILVQEDSVTADCKMLVEKDGFFESKSIGELVDGLLERHGFEEINGVELLPANPEGLQVFALGKDGKVRLAPVSQFSRHKVSKDIFEVKTRTGRSIKVTGDHSLFGLQNNKIDPVKCNELHEGSFIAVPRKLPWASEGIGNFSLLDDLELLPKNSFICGKDIKDFVSENFKNVKEFSLKNGFTKSAASAWKRNAVLPLKVFRHFENEIPKQALLFKLDRRSRPIPCSIPVTENLLNITGLWLADGSYDSKYAVIISTPDCKEEISQFAESLGLKARNHSDGFSYIISNTGLNFFFKKILTLEGNAYSKKFPDWVFRLSESQLSQMLKGLYSGDGYNSKYEVGISLCSESLINSLQDLLSAFGIVSRKGKLNPRDKTFRLSISSLKNINFFSKSINFLQERKQKQLALTCSRTVTHDNSDIIPFSIPEKHELSKILAGFNNYDYAVRGFSVGREKFKSLVSTALESRLIEDLKVLAFSDVFWDEIVEVKNLGKTEQFVYDFSIPNCESFVCNGIVCHNTLEIPVPYMKEIGFNIQRLKTRSPISVSKTETEVAPEESLRTALRLGDSALILGEVRSLEAKVLYEAMRIGAAGNIVMGTIHGDSAYSVWDRVVNDLQVPNTSFKATDIVVVARPIRFGGSLNRVRRVVQVTEVKKHWVVDPEREGGLLDLMLYDAKKDTIDLLEDNLKESDLFSKISKISGLTMQEMWKSIRMNASSKEFMVKLKNELNLPELLEAENTVIANNKLMMLKQDQIDQFSTVDYDAVLGEWKNWTREVFAKRIAGRKK